MAISRPALVSCEVCPDKHPRATHAPDAAAACRIGGCPCTGFYSPELRVDEELADDEQTGGRVVMVTVPDGYEAIVTLRPVFVVGERGPEVIRPTSDGVVLSAQDLRAAGRG